MRGHKISDDNWSRSEHLLPGRGGHGGVAWDIRGFDNAVQYVAKTGIPRRDLPDRSGKWDTAFHRFNAWCKAGVWRRVLEAVRDPDLEWLMIDSTGDPGGPPRSRDDRRGRRPGPGAVAGRVRDEGPPGRGVARFTAGNLLESGPRRRHHARPGVARRPRAGHRCRGTRGRTATRSRRRWRPARRRL